MLTSIIQRKNRLDILEVAFKEAIKRCGVKIQKIHTRKHDFHHVFLCLISGGDAPETASIHTCANSDSRMERLFVFVCSIDDNTSLNELPIYQKKNSTSPYIGQVDENIVCLAALQNYCHAAPNCVVLKWKRKSCTSYAVQIMQIGNLPFSHIIGQISRKEDS